MNKYNIKTLYGLEPENWLKIPVLPLVILSHHLPTLHGGSLIFNEQSIQSRKVSHDPLPQFSRGRGNLVTVSNMLELPEVHKGTTAIVKQKSQFYLFCNNVNSQFLTSRLKKKKNPSTAISKKSVNLRHCSPPQPRSMR